MDTQLRKARRAVTVTPSDSTDLAKIAYKGLYIGGTGNIAVIPSEGSGSVVFNAVPVGFFPVAVKRVLATGTTATNIVALS